MVGSRVDASRVNAETDRDDPVSKYLPKFRYRLDGFVPEAKAESVADAPITLFQLASHMSGLGRDWPPGTVHGWPHSMDGGGPPPTNGLEFPDHAAMYRATANTRLTTPPFVYPAYSNTGIALLGMALTAANRMASKTPNEEPATFAELAERDIFRPLGMNDSHFLTTDENKHNVVVPSLSPAVAVCIIFGPRGSAALSSRDVGPRLLRCDEP